MLRLVSLVGLCAVLTLCWALSRHRRAISWRLVWVGLAVQTLLGGVFLYWDVGNRGLRAVGQAVKEFLDLSARGTEFVFGDLGRISSPADLYLHVSTDGARFAPAGLLARGASSPALAALDDGRVLAVFQWPAADLPAALGGLGASVRGADGKWSPPAAVAISGLPADLSAPYHPCLARLRDGRVRLYFSSHVGARGPIATYSAISDDGLHYTFEPGVRFSVAGEVVAHASVAQLGALWHYYAPVRGRSGTAYHATSEDGLRFARQADVTAEGAGPWQGTALATAAGLEFYGAGWIGISRDGEVWSAGPPLQVPDTPVVDPGVARTDGGATLIALPGRSGFAFVFATQVTPTLIFFSAFMAVLYHLGIMQAVVRAMAVVMARLLGTSGAESLSACGNVFLGQTEAPLMVRPFLATMTMSELHAVMTGGFATIAGGVFALYVGFGIDPGHLMVASVMAVPAGLVCSKLMWPETQTPETLGRVVIDQDRRASNVVEAAATGALDGLRLALNVAAMLIAFLGLVAVLDWILGALGGLVGFPELDVGALLGWAFSPIAAVMGVPKNEILTLAELLGTKIALTELVAYQQLGALKQAGALSDRTILVASFALCGFANIGSVAIQIGGLGAMAIERKADLSRIALRAMFAGAIATCMTACMAGVMSDV